MTPDLNKAFSSIHLPLLDICSISHLSLSDLKMVWGENCCTNCKQYMKYSDQRERERERDPSENSQYFWTWTQHANRTKKGLWVLSIEFSFVYYRHCVSLWVCAGAPSSFKKRHLISRYSAAAPVLMWQVLGWLRNNVLPSPPLTFINLSHSLIFCAVITEFQGEKQHWHSQDAPPSIPHPTDPPTLTTPLLH